MPPGRLSLEAGKLALLVLNALHGLLVFYERDHEELNLDSLFGLKVLEGQAGALRDLLAQRGGAPPPLLTQLANLTQAARRVATKARAATEADNPAYFKSFRFLVDTPWDILGPHTLTSARLMWPLGGGLAENERNGISEADSDECMGQLLNSVSLRPPGAFSGCSQLDTKCLDRMLDKIGMASYSITHQLLFTSVAQRVNCTEDLDSYTRKIRRFRRYGLDGWRREWCTNLLNEMKSLWRTNTKDGMWTNINVIDKDLFLEQVFTCGQFGFSEFAARAWLDEILTWQDESGCFGRREIQIRLDEAAEAKTENVEGDIRAAMESARGDFEARGLGRRQLRVEKLTKDACGGHTNAVAVGALSVFLRFILDPGPIEFGHHPIFLQPSRVEAHPVPFISLDIRPWGLAPLGQSELEHIGLALEPKPPSSPSRDLTAYFLLTLTAVFLYATWRLFFRRRKALALYPFAYKKL